MSSEEVVAAYATALFVRSEAEVRRPVVLLTGERTNVYGVLEKHFRETALPPSERFWRAVRSQWTPMLDTWRPRVNGVQLKVLAGARLPESEDEWATLRTALTSVRHHLRPDSSVDALHAELRDFVHMVVGWWENRRKTETGVSTNGTLLLKRAASAGLLLGGGTPGMGVGLAPVSAPASKKPCLEFLPLGPPHHPPTHTAPMYHTTLYAAPEIVSVPLLTGGSGSGRLPDRMPLALPAGGGDSGELPSDVRQVQELGGTQHGGTGYMQQLAGISADSRLFDQLFPAGHAAAATTAGAGVCGDVGSGAGLHRSGSQSPDKRGAGAAGFNLQSPQAAQEGSADNQAHRVPMAPHAAVDGKRFVALNVGGHRFMTTAATLAAVEGSYFAKLAQQAGSAHSSSEFFVDRSGKIFEYVLDFLRSRRFSDSPSTLPKDERTLHMLAREADFYRLPELAERARSLLATAAAATAATAARAAAVVAGAEDDPSGADVPTHIAAEGSAHGGQLLLGRMGSAAVPAGIGARAMLGMAQQAQQAAAVLDAVFVETGFVEVGELARAQTSLLEELNATVAAKQGGGFAVVDFKCGTERDGSQRNLYYHVLLRK